MSQSSVASISASSGAGGSNGDGCPATTTLVQTIAACGGVGPGLPSALSASLEASVRGDLVGLAGVDVPSVPCAQVTVCRPDHAPTLLFSDEPETTSSDGITYADVIGPGAYRVYVYHVNGGSSLRKFPVVALNQGASNATVTLTRKGLAGPGTDYVAVGKSAVHDWLLDSRATSVTVPAGQRVLLDGDLDGLHAQQNELVHAIIDFTVDAPIKLSVVSVPAASDAAALTASLSVIPNSGLHVRGSFPNAQYLLVNHESAQGIRSISLGDDLVDPDLQGQSFVDGGAAQVLHGNFGVPYDVSFPFVANGALGISPRGGAWAGAELMSAGDDQASGLALLPSSQTTLDVATSAIVSGRFHSGSLAGGTIMTAGGSSLPVTLLILPLSN